HTGIPVDDSTRAAAPTTHFAAIRRRHHLVLIGGMGIEGRASPRGRCRLAGASYRLSTHLLRPLRAVPPALRSSSKRVDIPSTPTIGQRLLGRDLGFVSANAQSHA